MSLDNEENRSDKQESGFMPTIHALIFKFIDATW